MARFAKKGTKHSDIAQKLYLLYAKLRGVKEAEEILDDEIPGLKIRSFEDVPPEQEENFFYCVLHVLRTWSYSKVLTDISKIDFDFENVGLDFEGNSKLDDDTEIIWCWAGGDWEYPVRFVLYIDPNNELRGYIPEDGNIYCHKCKKAYGTCECDEEANNRVFGQEDLYPDYKAMYEDVKKRIEVI